MDAENARRILKELRNDARVVDVGGGGSPFPRADYVLDLTPYDSRAALGHMDVGGRERFTRETWIEMDLCGRAPWPFEDDFFDFAVCSHLLEDVRDPIWICSEMSRVAKAGYIEVPSRVIEQSRGVEHPLYAGFYHHRWLIDAKDGCLVFRHKPHSLHMIGEAIVADVGVSKRIARQHTFLVMEWTGCLNAQEVLEFNEESVNAELRQYACATRRIPDLLEDSGLSMRRKLGKALYFLRLKLRGRKAFATGR